MRPCSPAAWACASVLLLTAACSPHGLGDDEHAPITAEPTTPLPEDVPAPAPVPAPEPTTPTAANPPTPRPYPSTYCAEVDLEHWSIRVDPRERAHLRTAERLLERYPEADGRHRQLARSNVPLAWRELRAVTLVTAAAPRPSVVKKIGVRPTPSGAGFTFILDADAPARADTLGLAVVDLPADATVTLRGVERRTIDDAHWSALNTALTGWIDSRVPRTIRKTPAQSRVRRITAAFGGDVVGLLQFELSGRYSALVAVTGAGALLEVPLTASEAPTPGVHTEARYEVAALVDLDGDGNDEAVVHEVWPEGLYVWIVRYDRDASALRAELLCGDAS